MTHLLKKVSQSPIAFGGAAISGEGGGYGFGNITESESIELLDLAFSLGVRVFDTAPIYGFGLSEKRIGIAFKKNREEVFIVSKSGVTWSENKRVDMTNDPQVTVRMLEQSLRDLQTDYIDLYMIHWPDSRVDIRRPMEVLAKAKAQGKIKHIGLCNTNVSELDLAHEIEKIEVVQSEFNFFQTKAADDLFPYLKDKNISFMSWGTLDKGILTGLVTEARKFETSDCRSWAPWWKKTDNLPKIEAVRHLQTFLNTNNHSTLELALANNLSYPELSMAICGSRNKDQLLSLFKALDNLPNAELIHQARKLAKVL